MNNRTKIEVLALLKRAGVNTVNQEIVLYCLEERQGIRAAPLGRILDITSCSAGRVLEGLEREELARSQAINDGKAKPFKRYYITDKGRTLLRHIREAEERGEKAAEVNYV